MPNCSKCGAALSPGAALCEYCGSVVEVPPSVTGAGRPFADVPRFKKTSVVLMLLLCIFTLGLYCGIWYLRRRGELKKLDPAQSQKMDVLINIYAVCLSFYLIVFFLRGSHPEIADFISFMNLTMLGISFYISCFVRKALRFYVAHGDTRGTLLAFVAPSLLWTCVFGIFYLQAHINKLINARVFEAR